MKKVVQIKAYVLLLLFLISCFLGVLIAYLYYMREQKAQICIFETTLASIIYGKVALAPYISDDEALFSATTYYAAYEAIQLTLYALQDGLNQYAGVFGIEQIGLDSSMNVHQLTMDLQRIKNKMYDLWQLALIDALTDNDKQYLNAYCSQAQLLLKKIEPTLNTADSPIASNNIFVEYVILPLHDFAFAILSIEN